MSDSFSKLKFEYPECFALLITQNRLIPTLLICAYSYPSLDYFKALNNEIYAYLKNIGIELDRAKFSMTSIRYSLSKEEKLAIREKLKPLDKTQDTEYFGGAESRVSYTHETYKNRQSWIESDFESMVNCHKAGLLHHIIFEK